MMDYETLLHLLHRVPTHAKYKYESNFDDGKMTTGIAKQIHNQNKLRESMWGLRCNRKGVIVLQNV